MLYHLLYSLFLLGCRISCIRGFATPAHHVTKHPNRYYSSALLLASNNDDNRFDIAKPIFDLYSFRNIRGDALAKYNSLNQSEPLRINLSALLAFVFFSAPSLVDEINGEPASLPQIAGYIVAGTASASLFIRECGQRSKQLNRIEKELNALSLRIRMPRKKILGEMGPAGLPQTIQSLQMTSGLRFLAICGTVRELRLSLQQLQVLGRRLVQSSTYVIAVPTDGSSRKDWGLIEGNAYPWFAEPDNIQEWVSYFGTLSSNGLNRFKWIAFSSSGRSVASGENVDVSWLQLLGRYLRPTVVLGENDPFQEDSRGLLLQLSRFYSALTSGSISDMTDVYSMDTSDDVTLVVKDGGRLDNWSECLKEGNRPAGMKVADADWTIVDDVAYTTVIEHPVLANNQATLLAVQTWTFRDSTWKLLKHQTIPWSDQPARGTLMCDCRGCVSLAKTREKRTVGGLIG